MRVFNNTTVFNMDPTLTKNVVSQIQTGSAGPTTVL